MTETVAEPGRMARLPHDRHGRPVPWFVMWHQDMPDFRVVRQGALAEAVARRLCWVCGVPFTRQEPRAFVIGPMCAVNRTSSEPPSHYECARYSALACPFLTRPDMKRRDKHLPEGTTEAPGIMLLRNPGVTLVWVARYNDWAPVRVQGGTLFDIGDPLFCEWYAEGRPATRAEVIVSIDTGAPALREVAERQGPAALAVLGRQLAAALKLAPA